MDGWGRDVRWADYGADRERHQLDARREQLIAEQGC
jgi:hypothetical protein